MDDFQVLLDGVLTRRIPPREGMARLRQWATVEFDANPAYVNFTARIDDDVPLTPPAVRTALEAYLAGDMAAAELRDWAIFIVLSGHYSTSEPPPYDEDWYDPLWGAIYDLACPEVHGPITSAGVAKLLEPFERFTTESGGSAV